MTYLSITENGAGRIDFSNTPTDIDGLVVKRLETCTAIVIIGDKGISVIHDESYLKIDDIEKEFDYVGNLKEWSIFYNPIILKGQELKNRQKEMTLIINKFNGKYSQENEEYLFNQTTTGEVVINKNIRKISEIKYTTSGLAITEPQEISHRTAIRHLNNMCASAFKLENTTHRIVSIDIQFDGKNQKRQPPLTIPDKNLVVSTIIKTINSWPYECSKERTEYMNYLRAICPNETLSYENNLPKSALEKFKTLEKIYENNRDENLLINLYQLASKACGECANSNDYEGAEEYDNQAQQYLKLALKSNNKSIHKEAERLLKEQMQSNSEEEHSPSNNI